MPAHPRTVQCLRCQTVSPIDTRVCPSCGLEFAPEGSLPIRNNPEEDRRLNVKTNRLRAFWVVLVAAVICIGVRGWQDARSTARVRDRAIEMVISKGGVDPTSAMAASIRSRYHQYNAEAHRANGQWIVTFSSDGVVKDREQLAGIDN